MGLGSASGSRLYAGATRRIGVLRVRGLHVGVAAMVLAAALSLCGCDSQPDPTAPATTKGGAKRPTDASAGEMVAAFSANRAQGGLVDLKFLISRRPQVDEPVDIDLALTPSVPLEGLFARFQAGDGLQLVSGAETEHVERPAAGVAVGHRITVVAKADGIYYITAIVLADSEKESVARTFSIPLIAGQGLAEPPPAPASASVADPKRAPATP